MLNGELYFEHSEPYGQDEHSLFNFMISWVYDHRANPSQAPDISSIVDTPCNINPIVFIQNPNKAGVDNFLVGSTFQSHSEVCEENNYDSFDIVHSGFLLAFDNLTHVFLTLSVHNGIDLDKLFNQVGKNVVLLDNQLQPYAVSNEEGFHFLKILR